MTLRRLIATAVLVVVAIGAPTAAATPAAAAPFDCKEAPTPQLPGRGLPGFFVSEPEKPPAAGNPFLANPTTTIYEQYGYAGLRWNTYDLGCGPDAVRQPDAIVGNTMANWLMQLPVTFAAMTDAIVRTALAPTFLQVFDPLVTNVVTTLHEQVFAAWVPLVLAGLGLLLLLRARRASLASSAAAVGWALLVLIVTAALLQWPLGAGRFADQSVAATLGAVSGGLAESDTSDSVSPAARSASNVHEALLYQTWLAGTFGDGDSEVALKYGPDIFTAQALTWAEARTLGENPDEGRRIIEAKRALFSDTAGKVKDEDPDAYEYLIGKRSDTRVGYAALAAFGALCALPFLVVASLLLLTAFLIVRFAVMLFPAFATLGVFPAARGLVVGIGTTVGAALLNGTIFGIAAIITVRAIGLILDPTSALPQWLALVLMLLVTIVLWIATKPFRRLTTMVPGGGNVFGDAVGGLGNGVRSGRRWARQAGTAAFAAYTGGSAALAAQAGSNLSAESAELDRDESALMLSRERAAGTVRVEGQRPNDAGASEDAGATTVGQAKSLGVDFILGKGDDGRSPMAGSATPSETPRSAGPVPDLAPTPERNAAANVPTYRAADAPSARVSAWESPPGSDDSDIFRPPSLAPSRDVREAPARPVALVEDDAEPVYYTPARDAADENA